MAAENRGKKRVRIQSGHEERFIEKRKPKHGKKRVKAKAIKKAISNKMIQKSRINSSGRSKTHKPTVAELVYKFLERASNRHVAKAQRTNATKAFRQLQRQKHPKRLKPNARIKKTNKIPKVGLTRKIPKEDYLFPYHKIPSKEGNESIEKCIFEVLTYGTVLGLLEPADKKGTVFRVSSDLSLFNKISDQRRINRKRKLNLVDDIAPSKHIY